MNKMRKKLSMVVLGVVLVMALSVTAFASSAWDSFSTKLPANQGDTEVSTVARASDSVDHFNIQINSLSNGYTAVRAWAEGSWGGNYSDPYWELGVGSNWNVYYYSMSKFLVVRKSKLRYMLSKVISVFSFTFVFCMFLLSLNLLLTFLIFDVRAPFTEQYQRLVPNAGTFGYTLYQISPLLMAVVYSFFNSLALALFAVFALAIQMIVKFKNQYVAIVIPVILLYAITFAFDSVPLLLPYDIRIIIQPRSANAITEIVTKQDFEITFCAWIVADSFLTLIGLARNKDIL